MPRKAASAGELNLYSSRHYDTDIALYENFTEATGIKINLIEAGADELIERIKSEGEASPADLLLPSTRVVCGAQSRPVFFSPLIHRF